MGPTHSAVITSKKKKIHSFWPWFFLKLREIYIPLDMDIMVFLVLIKEILVNILQTLCHSSEKITSELRMSLLVNIILLQSQVFQTKIFILKYYTENGQLYTWGFGGKSRNPFANIFAPCNFVYWPILSFLAFGALGLGSNQNRYVPALVEDYQGGRIVDITSGNNFVAILTGLFPS